MKLVFMGTPDFAVPSLEKLIACGYEVAAVFTQPDKPKGRGHKLQAPPVKELALSRGIPVYQPEKMKTGEAAEIIAGLTPELIIVAAYGKMLPKNILELPKYGCVNVHGSLLPKYRGAAPIQWAVINGEKTTGVTIMYMAEGMDTGDMIAKRETEIGENETSGRLFDRLSLMGAELLADTLPHIIDGTAKPQKQDDSAATHAPMISKELSVVDWSKPATEIKNLIRGLNPWPCAVTSIEGKRLKVFAAELCEDSGESGTAFCKEGKFCVCCGEDSLVLTDIQPENGKRMAGESYLLGHPIQGEVTLGQ